LAVLDKAAGESDWGRKLPEGWGRGIALQRSFGTIVSQVLEVEVVDGAVRVDRVVCAVDPGFAVNPDGLAAQIESGVIYGLTAALYGEISIENGAVKQSNFHDYEMVRMPEAPKIETHIINGGQSWGGAGEPGTPTVAPALANAVFDATGTRIRELPLKVYDLTFSVDESESV
ncbi:MAG: molybdopterin cofactor-binding domain-containing protein, partial [Pseudomonadales bacterium]